MNNSRTLIGVILVIAFGFAIYTMWKIAHEPTIPPIDTPAIQYEATTTTNDLPVGCPTGNCKG